MGVAIKHDAVTEGFVEKNRNPEKVEMNKSKTRCLSLAIVIVGVLVIGSGVAMGQTGIGLAITCETGGTAVQGQANYTCTFTVTNASTTQFTINTLTVDPDGAGGQPPATAQCLQGINAVTSLAPAGEALDFCTGVLFEGNIPFSCSPNPLQLIFGPVFVQGVDAGGNSASQASSNGPFIAGLVCGDGDACTADSCVPGPGGTGPNAGGCVFTPVVCNDGDACTIDSCDPATGSTTVCLTEPNPDPSCAAPGCGLLVIDEDSIDNGNLPNQFSDVDVNDQIARIGLRAQLPVFAAAAGAIPPVSFDLWTGSVGDEGWFALKTIPANWSTSGLPADGLLNYWLAGPGLGSGKNREKRLDKIPDVTPLRATGLAMLEGSCVCAVVYDSDISINYGPLNGSLKGANLGVVAFTVNTVTRLTGQSSSSLPVVNVTPLDADTACDSLGLFTAAPTPISSSDPFDVVP